MVKLFLALIVGALIILGCGGHHRSAIVPVNTDSLIGSWSGTYRQSLGSGTGVGHRSGAISLTITRSNLTGHDAGVQATGTVKDSERGEGTVTGYVTDYVQAVGSGFGFTFPDTVQSNDLYKGRLATNAEGHLVGTLGLYLGDGSIPTEFDLAPVTKP